MSSGRELITGISVGGFVAAEVGIEVIIPIGSTTQCPLTLDVAGRLGQVHIIAEARAVRFERCCMRSGVNVRALFVLICLLTQASVMV